MRNPRYGLIHRVFIGSILALAAILTAGCDSTIHRSEVIGGVDTLSIDAKQRLMLVGDRVGQDTRTAPQRRVECAEPSPDAIVAKAAALAASADVNAGSNGSGGGGLGGGISETAASIGYRDHTVQMLRDGFYRLCEAYMNGGISERAYRNMIMNADTFMVVASALQILGTNPVAKPVVVSAGSITAAGDSRSVSVGVTGQQVQIGSADPKSGDTPQISIQPNFDPASTIKAENAAVAQQIIHDYLRYRERLNIETARADKQEDAALRSRGVR